MSTLSDIAGQILDKLSDVVLGPVQGTIATTATAPVWVPQGTVATLPDGRIVRVVQATKVQTTSTLVPVRLLYLSPSIPSASNFASVSAGTVATWVNRPAGLAATGTTSAFAAHARACVGSVAEFESLTTEASAYEAGANGRASAVLLSPDISFPNGSEHRARRQIAQAQWKLRVNVMLLSPQKERRATVRDIYDALQASLMGATAGTSNTRFVSWKQVRSKDNCTSFELAFNTWFYADGRQSQPQASASFPTFDEVDAIITQPGGGFTVEEIL